VEGFHVVTFPSSAAAEAMTVREFVDEWKDTTTTTLAILAFVISLVSLYQSSKFSYSLQHHLIANSTTYETDHYHLQAAVVNAGTTNTILVKAEFVYCRPEEHVWREVPRTGASEPAEVQSHAVKVISLDLPISVIADNIKRNAWMDIGLRTATMRVSGTSCVGHSMRSVYAPHTEKPDA
jgi:hypothetical protein